MSDEYGTEHTKGYFRNKLMVTEEKILLSEETEANERAIINTSWQDHVFNISAIVNKIF